MKRGSLYHKPSIDVSCRECTHEEITAENHVEDAGHEELNELRSVDDFAPEALAEHLLGDLVVREAHLELFK